jgi:hypothetical protein
MTIGTRQDRDKQRVGGISVEESERVFGSEMGCALRVHAVQEWIGVV